jgi:hypothetical protein
VTRIVRVAMIAGVLLAGMASPILAQGIPQQPTLPDPEQTGRYRLGFIRFTPSMNLTNLGVDTNVFNEVEDPKEDFTAVFGPKAEFWSRLGPRAHIYGSVGLDYQYFNEYESQRSFGTSNVARLDFDLGRLTPFAEGQYANTRVRPGFEIDERARRRSVGGRAGLAARVQSKTRVIGWIAQEEYRFDDSAAEAGEVNLSYALDRDSSSYGAGLEVELTPLTTLLVDVERAEDRFAQSPERDADSSKVMGGFKFKPFALIDGRVAVGYRQFETLEPIVPDFDGFIATVDLGYTLRATRVNAQYNRDVTYSFETFEPYYLQTDWQVSVTQKITSTWDVVGRAGRYTLDYERVGVVDAFRRTDTGSRYGGGIGYTVGQYLRLGFDVNYIDRRSEADVTRNYEGIRAGFTITYGLRQR